MERTSVVQKERTQHLKVCIHLCYVGGWVTLSCGYFFVAGLMVGGGGVQGSLWSVKRSDWLANIKSVDNYKKSVDKLGGSICIYIYSSVSRVGTPPGGGGGAATLHHIYIYIHTLCTYIYISSRHSTGYRILPSFITSEPGGRARSCSCEYR